MSSSLAYFPTAFLFVSVGYYAYLWYFPTRWMSFVSPNDPCTTMARVSMVMRLFQWCCALSISSLSLSYYQPWVYFGAFICIAAGQYLNARVYQLLGQTGVYYGSRFGKKVPWVTEFPYGVIRDPQYVGSILTFVGTSVWTPAHFTVGAILSYIILIIIEAKVPETR